MKEKTLSIRIACLIGGLLALTLSTGLIAQDDDYVSIEDDLSTGMELQEVANRAYENADGYWENYPGPIDGDDEKLSAGEAVTAIYTHASDLPNADPLARDIVSVTKAVVDAWPDCQDTFDAVRAAVTNLPGRADEIVANIAVKRNCNCSNGGLWLDQRVDDRIRVESRHSILDVPIQCSCSQVAMFAGIAGLPENREFDPNMSDEEKAVIIDRMTEQVQVITDRTTALQSMNSWECGCTNINIAASMQGIKEDELRDGAYDGLAEKYAEDAADNGLVVDAFGVVGMHPADYWGDGEYVSQSNVLRRKNEIFRGDNLILDPFHPETEFTAHGDGNHNNLGQHSHTSGNIPTDLVISEYIEGWNKEALKLPPQDRDPKQRNRVVELYNGSEERIDLGNDQYFMEIYAGPGTGTMAAGEYSDGDMDPRQVIGLNGAVEPGETWIIAFDQSDDNIKEKANEVTGQLDFQPNETLVVRRMGGEMALNCRAQSYAYVINYPPEPYIRYQDPYPRNPPGNDEVASPN
jgi:hypothetical protein